MPLSCCMPMRKTARMRRGRDSDEKTSRIWSFLRLRLDASVVLRWRLSSMPISACASTSTGFSSSFRIFSRSAVGTSSLSQAAAASTALPCRVSQRGEGGR